MPASGAAFAIKRAGGDARFVALAMGRGTGAEAPACLPCQAACGFSVASAAPPARLSALIIALTEAVTMFSSMPTP